MTRSVPPSLRLAEFATALSLATDLGQGKPMEMVLATCLLALRLGELLGVNEDELQTIYYLSLFHHAGCTADSQKAASIFGDDLSISPGFFQSVDPTQPWTLLKFMWRNIYTERPLLERAIQMPQVLNAFMEAIRAHCEVAQLFAARLGLDSSLQKCLLQCNESWNGRGVPGKLKGEAIERAVRIVQVAQEAVALAYFTGEGTVVASLRTRAGVTLDPLVVERFCASADHLLERSHIGESSLRELVLSLEPGQRTTMTDEQIEAATHALGDFADLKTSYTVGHSCSVAHLVSMAAPIYGLAESEAILVRRAGYIHDVGRVGISSSIWCKPYSLTETEWEKVRLYPYYTDRVFAQSEILRAWGNIASTHCERLDGSGYYRNLTAPMLTPSMRLLAAANKFRGLNEQRPYRKLYSEEEAVQEIKREVRAGRLDREAVNAVLAVAGHRLPVRQQYIGGLTERELDVLRLVAHGLTNPEIAKQLVLSRKTVGNHLQNIYEKINVSTRAAATYYAMQHHLV